MNIKTLTYGLIIAIIVTISLGAFIIVTRSSNNSSSIEDNLLVENLNNSDEIEIGDIYITGQDITDILTIDDHIIRNCTGSEPLEISRTFENQVERTINISTDVSLGIPLPLLLIEAQIRTHFEMEENETLTESITVTMRSAPGTSVNYEINWLTVSTSGVIEIIHGRNIETVEFLVPSTLRADVFDQGQNECDADE